ACTPRMRCTASSTPIATAAAATTWRTCRGSAGSWPGGCRPSPRPARRGGGRLPAFAEAGLDGVWAGIYPISPDGEPSIGPHASRPTVHAAFGGGGAGFQSAPGIGRTVAEWIVHGEPRTAPGVRALLPDRA